MASGRIKGLDGARAIAVLCVFLVHRTKQFSHTQIGHVAVEVFFALSGYLIVGILSEQRRAIEAGRGTLVGELTTFFQKRTFRIMPVYYLALAVICGLAAAGVVLEGFEWRQVPWHLFYVTNFLVARLGHWPALFGHFWSLAIEEQFYLLAAPVILLIPARRHMLICLAVIAAAYLSMVLQILGRGWSLAAEVASLWNFGIIALGGLARLTQPVVSRVVPKVPSWVAWACAATLLASVVCSSFGPPWFVVGISMSVGPLAAVFILGLAMNQEGALTRLLEHPRLVRLGTISYGFYLFHALIPQFRWFTTHFHWKGIPFDVAINFAMAYALSAASYELFELPIMRWGKALREGRKSTPKQAAEASA